MVMRDGKVDGDIIDFFLFINFIKGIYIIFFCLGRIGIIEEFVLGVKFFFCWLIKVYRLIEFEEVKEVLKNVKEGIIFFKS